MNTLALDGMGGFAMSSLYTRRFFEEVMAGSASSAGVVVPLVLSLVPARSVCDVGCGAGDWLRVFMEHGVDDIVGVDGDYVSGPILRIPQGKFHPHDLATQLNLSRQFDLTISLEVAEHLPKTRAVGFVEDLTRLSPVVLFSAAVPGQGGIGHVNEQWQHYWADIFARFQFTVFDALRPHIWTDRSVESYYRQNILLYCREDYVRHYPALSQTVAQILSLAHPELYAAHGSDRAGVRDAAKILACSALRAIQKLIPRMSIWSRRPSR